MSQFLNDVRSEQTLARLSICTKDTLQANSKPVSSSIIHGKRKVHFSFGIDMDREVMGYRR